MRTVSIRLCDMGKTNIPIGFVGENLYTQVRIDSKKVFDDYPTAIASLTIVNPHGDVYPGFITRDDDVVVWTVNNSDLVYGGNGKIQLAFLVDDIVAKSYECRTYVSKALISPDNIPTPIASWIDAANVVLGEAEGVFEALDEMTVAAETLASGTSATAEISDVDGHKHIAFGIPKGDKGDQGNPGVDGSDGYSPTLVVSTITGGHRITITDKNGTSTVDIMDGEKGDTGATGNGISSVVLNQDYTLTINYTNGQSYTTTSIRGAKGETGDTGATPVISIGTVTTGDPDDPASATMDTTDPKHPVLSMVIPKGQPGSVPIDDTSTAADKVWSAQKTSNEVNGLMSAITQEKAPVIFDTASGEIVTIPDGANGMAVETLTVAIEPIQDLHGQANPYPGSGGKNKLPVSGTDATVNGISFTVNSDGSVFAKNVSTHSAASMFNYGHIVLPAGDYKVNGITGGHASSMYIEFLSGSYTGTRILYITDGDNAMSLEAETDVYVRVVVATMGLPNLNDSKTFYPMIRLSSVSDSTFAPYSNLCPISGWSAAEVVRTGFNLWDEEYEINKALNKDTGATMSFGTDGNIRVSSYINVHPNTAFYFKIKGIGSSSAANYAWYDKNKTFISSQYGTSTEIGIVTSPSNAEYLRFTYNTNLSSDVCINISDSNKNGTYEPGHVAVYPITFPTPPGTVYGGTLTVNQDGTGNLVVEYGITDLGDYSYNYQANNHRFVSSTEVSGMKFATSGSVPFNGSCSILPLIPADNTAGLLSNAPIGIATGTSDSLLRIRYNDITTDPTTFKTAVTGQKLVFELATKATYNLTALEVIELLKGNNNIWADCGDTTIEYPCDTKLYVDKKIMEAIANALNA